MTSPEENEPKTATTDEAPRRARGRPEPEPDTRPAVGAELQDKMAEQGLTREDITGA